MSVPVKCDDCHQEYALDTHARMSPSYYVCMQDQTLSYLRAYCPKCKRWSALFGRKALALAHELDLEDAPPISFPNREIERERNNWMARHSYDLEMLSNEMLLATANRGDIEAILADFESELERMSGATLEFDPYLAAVRRQDDQK